MFLVLRRLKSPLQKLLFSTKAALNKKPKYHNTKKDWRGEFIHPCATDFCATAIEIAAPEVTFFHKGSLNQKTKIPEYHKTKKIGGANLFAQVLNIFCTSAIKIAAPEVTLFHKGSLNQKTKIPEYHKTKKDWRDEFIRPCANVFCPTAIEIAAPEVTISTKALTKKPKYPEDTLRQAQGDILPEYQFTVNSLQLTVHSLQLPQNQKTIIP